MKLSDRNSQFLLYVWAKRKQEGGGGEGILEVDFCKVRRQMAGKERTTVVCVKQRRDGSHVRLVPQSRDVRVVSRPRGGRVRRRPPSVPVELAVHHARAREGGRVGKNGRDEEHFFGCRGVVGRLDRVLPAGDPVALTLKNTKKGQADPTSSQSKEDKDWKRVGDKKDRKTYKSTVGPRKGRDDRPPRALVRGVVGMVGVLLRERQDRRRVARARAGVDGHVETQEELERRSVRFGSGKGGRDLRGLLWEGSKG